MYKKIMLRSILIGCCLLVSVMAAALPRSYQDFISLDDTSRHIHSPSRSLSLNQGIILLPAASLTSYNSGYAAGMNDGGAWQGRGFNQIMRAGAAVQHELNEWWIRSVFAPEIWWTENRSFPIMPAHSQYGNAWGYFAGNIDLPQRFGDKPYSDYNWGSSEIRTGWRDFSFAFTHEPFWLGPTRQNALMVSTNAGGFPRLEFSIDDAVTPVGNFEMLTWWGRNSSSEFYTADGESVHNLFTGFSASWAPKFLPNFSMGIHRLVFTEWDNLDWDSATAMFSWKMDSSLGKDELTQRASLSFLWDYPETGLQVYGEWGRNDYSPQWRFILRAPEHSHAYTIGFRYKIPGPQQSHFIWSAELSDISDTRDYTIDLGVGKGAGFYNRQISPIGHAHNGQVLGAGVGPGADTQFTAVDWVRDRDLAIGLFVRRISRNKDWIYNDPDSGPRKPDPDEDGKFLQGDIGRMNVEFAVGVRGIWNLSSIFTAEAQLSVAENINWNYVEDSDRMNIRAHIGLTYKGWQ